jgi:acetyl-CoA acetyltransferase
MSETLRGQAAIVGVATAGTGEAPGRTSIELLGEAAIAAVRDAGVALEDLGYCPKGEGGRFVASGAIDPGGALNVNTNGGGLSCVHPGMYGLFLIVEAVTQLRGQAGERQVEAEIALCHGNGGTLASQATAILGTRATL